MLLLCYFLQRFAYENTNMLNNLITEWYRMYDTGYQNGRALQIPWCIKKPGDLVWTAPRCAFYKILHIFGAIFHSLTRPGNATQANIFVVSANVFPRVLIGCLFFIMIPYWLDTTSLRKATCNSSIIRNIPSYVISMCNWLIVWQNGERNDQTYCHLFQAFACSVALKICKKMPLHIILLDPKCLPYQNYYHWNLRVFCKRNEKVPLWYYLMCKTVRRRCPCEIPWTIYNKQTQLRLYLHRKIFLQNCTRICIANVITLWILRSNSTLCLFVCGCLCVCLYSYRSFHHQCHCQSKLM